ncbi:uncharacterized protein LOC143236346 [Tachypleus tridentatus]|uniref:uncharacterized protein LOC143236346 n=1 Tax=Tachypleus tridentatus TaxID=6853 RepID=UPI003FD47815
MYRSYFTLLAVFLLLFLSSCADAVPTSNETVSCDINSQPVKRVICYFNADDDTFKPNFINPCLCTHIVYSYLSVLPNLTLVPETNGNLKTLTSLKEINPHVKVLVSLRGTNIKNEKSLTNSEVDVEPQVSLDFAESIRTFVDSYNVDGVVIGIEYRGYSRLDNLDHHKEGVTHLIKVIRESLDKRVVPNDRIIGITVSRKAFSLINGYNFGYLSRYVDFFNLPAFDMLDSAGGSEFIHPGRLHGVGDMENMDSLADLMLSLGVPREKLVIGIPAHAVVYKVNASSESSRFIVKVWTTPYNKLCKLFEAPWWTVKREKDQTAPFVSHRDLRIGYDDEISVRLKAKYILLRKLGGASLWWINEDDYQDNCEKGPYPLLRNVWEVFSKNVKKNKKLKLELDNLEEYLEGVESQVVDVVDRIGIIDRFDGYNGKVCSRQGYYRHSEDCSRFYRCVKFNQYSDEYTIFEYDCPPGLVFDERYEVCNWPSWSPPCDGSGELFPIPKNTFICPGPGYFHDLENCRWFYYCTDFWGNNSLQAFEFKCPFNLVFDEKELLCNWPWLVPGCYNLYELFGTRIRGYGENRLKDSYKEARQGSNTGLDDIYPVEKSYTAYLDGEKIRPTFGGIKEELLHTSDLQRNEKKTEFPVPEYYSKYYTVDEQSTPQYYSVDEQSTPQLFSEVAQDNKDVIGQFKQDYPFFDDEVRQSVSKHNDQIQQDDQLLKQKTPEFDNLGDSISEIKPIISDNTGRYDFQTYSPEHKRLNAYYIPNGKGQYDNLTPNKLRLRELNVGALFGRDEDYVQDKNYGRYQSDQERLSTLSPYIGSHLVSYFMSRDDVPVNDNAARYISPSYPILPNEHTPLIPLVIIHSPQTKKNTFPYVPQIPYYDAKSFDYSNQAPRQLFHQIYPNLRPKYRITEQDEYIPIDKNASPPGERQSSRDDLLHQDRTITNVPDAISFDLNEAINVDHKTETPPNEKIIQQEVPKQPLNVLSIPITGEEYNLQPPTEEIVLHKHDQLKPISSSIYDDPPSKQSLKTIYQQIPKNANGLLPSNKEISLGEVKQLPDVISPDKLYDLPLTGEAFLIQKDIPVQPLKYLDETINQKHYDLLPPTGEGFIYKNVPEKPKQIHDVPEDNNRFDISPPTHEISIQPENPKPFTKTSDEHITDEDCEQVPPNILVTEKIPKQLPVTIDVPATGNVYDTLPPSSGIFPQQNTFQQPLTTSNIALTGNEYNGLRTPTQEIIIQEEIPIYVTPPSFSVDEEECDLPPSGLELSNQEEVLQPPLKVLDLVVAVKNYDSLPPAEDLVDPEPLLKGSIPQRNDVHNNLPHTNGGIIIKQKNQEKLIKNPDKLSFGSNYDLPPPTEEIFFEQNLPPQPIKTLDLTTADEECDLPPSGIAPPSKQELSQQPKKTLDVTLAVEEFNPVPPNEELLIDSVPEQQLKSIDAPSVDNNYDLPPPEGQVLIQDVSEEPVRDPETPFGINYDLPPPTEEILVEQNLPPQPIKTLDLTTADEECDLPPSGIAPPSKQELLQQPKKTLDVTLAVEEFNPVLPNEELLIDSVPEQQLKSIDAPSVDNNYDLPSPEGQVLIQDVSEELVRDPETPFGTNYDLPPPTEEIVVEQNLPPQPIKTLDLTTADEECDLPPSGIELPSKQKLLQQPKKTLDVTLAVEEFNPVPPNEELLIDSVPEQQLKSIDAPSVDNNYDLPPPEGQVLIQDVSEEPVRDPETPFGTNYDLPPPTEEILVEQNLPPQPIKTLDLTTADEECDLPPSGIELPSKQKLLQQPKKTLDVTLAVEEFNPVPPNEELLIDSVPEQQLKSIDAPSVDNNYDLPSPEGQVLIQDVSEEPVRDPETPFGTNYDLPPPTEEIVFEQNLPPQPIKTLDLTTADEECDLPPSGIEPPSKQELLQQPKKTLDVTLAVEEFNPVPPNEDLLIDSVPEQLKSIDAPSVDNNYDLPPPEGQVLIQDVSEEPVRDPETPFGTNYDLPPPTEEILVEQNLPPQPIKTLDLTTADEECDLPPSGIAPPSKQELLQQPKKTLDVTLAVEEFNPVLPNEELLIDSVPEQQLKSIDAPSVDNNYDLPPPEGQVLIQDVSEEPVRDPETPFGTNYDLPPPTEEILVEQNLPPQPIKSLDLTTADEECDLPPSGIAPPSKQELSQQPKKTLDVTLAVEEFNPVPPNEELFIDSVPEQQLKSIDAPSVDNNYDLPPPEGQVLIQDVSEEPVRDPETPFGINYDLPPPTEEILVEQNLPPQPIKTLDLTTADEECDLPPSGIAPPSKQELLQQPKKTLDVTLAVEEFNPVLPNEELLIDSVPEQQLKSIDAPSVDNNYDLPPPEGQVLIQDVSEEPVRDPETPFGTNYDLPPPTEEILVEQNLPPQPIKTLDLTTADEECDLPPSGIAPPSKQELLQQPKKTLDVTLAVEEFNPVLPNEELLIDSVPEQQLKA